MRIKKNKNNESNGNVDFCLTIDFLMPKNC